MDILENVPVLAMREDSVEDQIKDLIIIGNKMGLSGAVSALEQLFSTMKLEDLRYGCYCDTDPNGIPFEDCVIDNGKLYNCIHAIEGIKKEQCEYWKLI